MQLIQAQIESSISSDSELAQDPGYRAVIGVLKEIAAVGLLQNAAGNCVAISEMAQHLLWDQGIKSRLVECRLMVVKPPKDQTIDWNFVGYDETVTQGKIDTHVVLIVDTERHSLLLDLSIQHLLPQGRLWICERLGSPDASDFLGHYQLDSYRFLYTIKKVPRLPELHQKNLVERIEIERSFRSSIKTLRWVLAGVALFTLINFALNTTQLYLRSQQTNLLERWYEQQSRDSSQPLVK